MNHGAIEEVGKVATGTIDVSGGAYFSAGFV